MKTITLILLIAIAPLGCKAYITHPGSINQFDSETYDSLISAKTIIDTARDQFSHNVLPPRFKTPLNDLIKAYDAAYPVYKLWHAAADKAQPADQLLAELNKDIAELVKAITAFRSIQ